MTVLSVADALKVGGTEVDKLYLGDALLWPLGTSEPLYVTEVLADNPIAYYRMSESGSGVKTATVSNYFGAEIPNYAFDGNPATFWTTNGSRTGWIRAELYAPHLCTSYAIRRRDDIPGRNPMDWTFEGSHDGTSWTVLDTQAGVTWPTAGELKTYPLANTTAYLYYRLNITAKQTGGDNYLSVAGLLLLPEVLPQDSSGNGRHMTSSLRLQSGLAGALHSDPDDTSIAFVTDSTAKSPAGIWPTPPAAFSAEAWIKTTYGAWQGILNMPGAWNLRLSNEASSRFQFERVGQSAVVSNRYVNDGQWHHLVATYDGTLVRLYVDGSLDSTPTGKTAPSAPTDGLEIGRLGSNYSFVGQLDEIAYYGTALSPARVQAHYAAAKEPYTQAVLADRPLIYWPFDELTVTTASDSSGNARHGTYSAVVLNAAALPPALGGSAASFNGSTSGVTSLLNGAPLNTAAFAVEAWIKPSTVAPSSQNIATRQNNANNQDSWTFYLTGTSLAFTVWKSGGLSAQTLTAPTVLAAGETYHVVAVHGGAGGRLKLYVNGVEVADVAADTAPYYGTPAPIRVGRYADGGVFSGVIDEFAYYGAALPPERVAEHHTLGAGG